MSEPFFTTKREQGGMGFGMAVVTRIINDHDGELTVTSSPGEGSTFTLRLPRRRAPKP